MSKGLHLTISLLLTFLYFRFYGEKETNYTRKKVGIQLQTTFACEQKIINYGKSLLHERPVVRLEKGSLIMGYTIIWVQEKACIIISLSPKDLRMTETKLSSPKEKKQAIFIVMELDYLDSVITNSFVF